MPNSVTNERSFWSQLNKRPWEELIAEDWGGYQPPLTIHLPIHPAGSRDFLHVGPAFQIVRQRIIPGLSANDMEALEKVKHEQTMLVQFAFGNPPFIPDLRRTQIALEDDRWPVPRLEYYAHEGLLYRFEYFSRTLTGDESQSILWIQGSVINDKQRTLGAHIRTKLSFPHENEVLDYHYQPFYWDASKMLSSPDIALEGEAILFQGEAVGRVVPHDFELEWEEKSDFQDEDYGRSRVEYSPPHSSRRYKQVRDAVHLHTELKPGESAAFELALLVNYEAITEAHREAMRQAQSTPDRDSALEHFRSFAQEHNTQLHCPTGNWSDIFAHLPLNTLQLIVQHLDVPGWMPTQGGSSERHFVWVGEALHQLVPLLKLGYFEPVRQALQFIFSFQDSGFKPMGRLTSTEGAIGTSGPKWLNSTGAALSIASEYYLHSRDEQFLDEYLPRMLHGMEWVLRELCATRTLNADGTRPPWYGLMPFGCANDGDYGYFVSFTDAYTFEGLSRMLAVLESTRHERAGELRKEQEQYRDDISQAVSHLTRLDGFIDRKIATGDSEEEIATLFNRIAGAFHLFSCGVLETDSDLCNSYVAWMEREQGNDTFIGRMDHDTYYMGWAEWAWQDISLKRREWKRAFAFAQINLKYGKSANTHQVQERFRTSDPTFCPWQPNGSGNGRMIDMMLKSIYFEYRGEVTLLAGIPFAWLRRNKTTSLRNLHTSRGVVSLHVEMLDSQRCAVQLTTDDSGVLPQYLRIPEHFAVEEIHNAKQLQRGLYSLDSNIRYLQCVIRSCEV